MPTNPPRERPWLLYLVKCADGTLYTGITTDLRRRLDQHNSGTASRYTRSRRPVELVYSEPCRDKSVALKKECRMKSLARKAKEARVADFLEGGTRLKGSRTIRPTRTSSTPRH